MEEQRVIPPATAEFIVTDIVRFTFETKEVEPSLVTHMIRSDMNVYVKSYYRGDTATTAYKQAMADLLWTYMKEHAVADTTGFIVEKITDDVFKITCPAPTDPHLHQHNQ